MAPTTRTPGQGWQCPASLLCLLDQCGASGPAQGPDHTSTTSPVTTWGAGPPRTPTWRPTSSHPDSFRLFPAKQEFPPELSSLPEGYFQISPGAPQGTTLPFLSPCSPKQEGESPDQHPHLPLPDLPEEQGAPAGEGGPQALALTRGEDGWPWAFCLTGSTENHEYPPQEKTWAGACASCSEMGGAGRP